MTIGGKVFPITNTTYPTLVIDITCRSPDKKNTVSHGLQKAIIDTGSDFTLIPDYVIKKLKLARTGRIEEIEDFNGEYSEVWFYSVKIIIDGIVDEIYEVGSIGYSETIIGMDIIKKWLMLINCSEGIFEIANK